MARLQVQVTPGARQEALLGWEGDVLRVRVAAPAREGRANAALVEALSRWLDVPARDIAIVRGQRARLKWVDIAGLNDATVRERLAAPPREGGGALLTTDSEGVRGHPQAHDTLRGGFGGTRPCDD
jgi:uncharacterized protein (TIGR00251 family)